MLSLFIFRFYETLQHLRAHEQRGNHDRYRHGKHGVLLRLHPAAVHLVHGKITKDYKFVCDIDNSTLTGPARKQASGLNKSTLETLFPYPCLLCHASKLSFKHPPCHFYPPTYEPISCASSFLPSFFPASPFLPSQLRPELCLPAPSFPT